ncbi:hypothetical protein ACHAWX_001391, partial [Stephanocyclus meneghinianus]
MNSLIVTLLLATSRRGHGQGLRAKRAEYDTRTNSNRTVISVYDDTDVTNHSQGKQTLQSNIDIPYSVTSLDDPNTPALDYFNLDDHRALVRRERKSSGTSKSNKSTLPSTLEQHKKRIPAKLLENQKLLSKVCKNESTFYCNNNMVEVCHYTQGTFRNTCISAEKAIQFLQSKKDYCGRCRSSLCDDHNNCTVDMWDSRHQTCFHVALKCPGDQRCIPNRGCIRTQVLCRNPPNIYRTCHNPRSKDNNSDDYPFQLNIPFKEPNTGSNELMVTGMMQLVLTQHDKNTVTSMSCNDKMGLEEVILKYLQDNIGDEDTFSPLCVFLGDANVQNKLVGGKSKENIQAIALKMSIIFAFKKFDKKIKGPKKRQRMKQHAMCRAVHVINSKGAPKSASCKKNKMYDSKTPQKPKFRDLQHDENLPDLSRQQFDDVVNTYTSFHPEETRAILDAQTTRDVATCALSRFIENKLDSGSFDCGQYNKFNCADNEDIHFKREQTR